MTLERKKTLAVIAVLILVGVTAFKDNLAEALSGVLWRGAACAAIGLNYLGSHAGTVAACVSILGLLVNFTFQYLNYRRLSKVS